MKKTCLSVSVILVLLFACQYMMAQGVSIKDVNDDPNAHAILDIDAVNSPKGILIPRLTTAERSGMSLTGDEEGLTVYDTETNSYWLWDGTAWCNFDNQPEHYVGEIFDNGIVFYVDETGEHGYMASLYDLDGAGTGSTVQWSDVTNTLIGDSAQNMFYGRRNTYNISNQASHTCSAASICEAYGTGWYLPSIRELMMLFSKDVIIDMVLWQDGDSGTYGLSKQGVMAPGYWSSTEVNASSAWNWVPNMGMLGQSPKSGACYVRAIKKF